MPEEIIQNSRVDNKTQIFEKSHEKRPATSIAYSGAKMNDIRSGS